MGVVVFLLGALVGGVVGLVLAVTLEDRAKEWMRRRARLRRSRAIERLAVTGLGAVSIGRVRTSVHIVEGDGHALLEPRNIIVKLSTSPAELPPLVARLKDMWFRRLSAKPDNSGELVAPWNSDSMVSLKSYTISRTSLEEDSTLSVEASVSDYGTFAATVLSLDEPIATVEVDGRECSTTLRQEYFPTDDKVATAVEKPIPFLSNGLGVMLLAFTDDRQVILVRRKMESRARPGERDVSVVEGLHAMSDRGPYGEIDIIDTAVRGCREELGIDVSREDVHILALGVDMRYYQWNFMGLVDARCRAAEVLEMYNLHAKDRWEGKLEPIKADAFQVLDRLRRDGCWDLGLVTTYLAFCYRYGVRDTQRAAKRVFG